MPGHRRVKDIELGDDYDDFGSDDGNLNGQAEELSPEDQEQMRQGTIAVREQLEPAGINASKSEIEETLYYYFYDVEKSVGYIKSKLLFHSQSGLVMFRCVRILATLWYLCPIPQSVEKLSSSLLYKIQATRMRIPTNILIDQYTPKEPKKQPQQKAPSRFDQAAAVAKSKTVDQQKADPLFSIDSSRSSPPLQIAKDFFHDTPWFNIPPERKGIIYEMTVPQKGGLLGGSAESKPGKQSKLAALAASRRKTQSQQKPTGDSLTEKSNQQEKGSVALLDKLASRPSHASTPIEKRGGRAATAPDTKFVNRPYKRQKKVCEDEPSTAQVATLDLSDEQPTADTDFPDGKGTTDAETSTANPRKRKITAAKCPASTCGALFTPLPTSFQQEHPHYRIRPVVTLKYPVATEYANHNPFVGPSPDDEVLQAQQHAFNKKPSQNGGGGNKKKAADSSKRPDTHALSKDLEATHIDDTSSSTTTTTKTPKNKHLDVPAEYSRLLHKNSANFVVIGHVDHGKSTLMGRLLHDLQIVNARSLSKLQTASSEIGKSSFALAWIMDSTPDERSRGITVDIATNTFSTQKTNFTILDAPGHQDFIPNMIAGASQADFAVLVIDAGTNAFESGLRGQTKEHALLVRSMGISRLVVAVNKMDTAGWSKERFDEVSQQLTAFLVTAGFAKKNVVFVPCAGLTGDNVTTPVRENQMPWYEGGTLVGALDASEPARRRLNDPLRVTVSEVFKSSSATGGGGASGTVSISGRIDAGSLQLGSQILAQPANETATVKSLQTSSSSPNDNPAEVEQESGLGSDFAVSGQILTTLALTNIDPIHLRPGDVLCDPANSPVRCVKQFTVKLMAFEFLMLGMGVNVHRGRLAVDASVSELLSIEDKKKDSRSERKKKKPRVIKPSQIARVRVELVNTDKGVPLETGDRVVIRAEGVSVGAGIVE
ncbi:MAG: Hsp70 suppressor, GTPase facilitates ribosomal subunit dissociation [Alyxoria varia]|nr:MAG: Hsp70 suppressor, GTPase facilitates ribosomal subunit dissociation [Alyxoria varia]